ncbi:DUF2703 domain-containing protein [Methanospirillum lacunae]|uniref:Uncharacterized protein n=1 Tax=Methanospirillum lacunae TaxID=668570 RepID=A0A2V2MU78_9EURY|nr:DUF2703 domain-containing protein [Methanospirillum lacunae]PWR70949.1 hypothetical protein DK846_13260 [Methanospirillum lacunae]
MNKEFGIERIHVGVDVFHTSVRCSNTRTTLASVIQEITPALTKQGIRIRYSETVLPSDQ